MHDICMYISCSKHFLNFVSWENGHSLIIQFYVKIIKKKPGKNEIVTFFGHRDKETRKKTEHPWTKIHYKINF